MNSSIRIVLVGITHPGNIGAAARAMKTMGLGSLYLVDPRIHPSEEATARAAGADDVLARAVVCDDLDQALADCHLVVGMSARRRRLSCPVLTPRESVPEIAPVLSSGGEVAILFGRESSGLDNAELDRCQMHVHIPCNPEYGSLNVAAAVQVMCYELNLGLGLTESGLSPSGSREPPPATAGQMEDFYRHLEQVMTATGFLNPARPGLLMRRLRRLFNRARPEHDEVQILRGILSSMQDKVDGSK